MFYNAAEQRLTEEQVWFYSTEISSPLNFRYEKGSEICYKREQNPAVRKNCNVSSIWVELFPRASDQLCAVTWA